MRLVPPSRHRGPLLRRLLAVLRSSSTPAGGATRRRIGTEALESRVLLSSYFVSTSGDDGNPGTLSAPFRTIQQAADVADPGDTVFIRGGTYRETVRPAHSGSASNPVTFKPY